MIAYLVVLLFAVANAQYNGCSPPSGDFEINLYAGGNALFFYTDKLNTRTSFSPESFFFSDSLISSPTEGFQYAGVEGAPLEDEVRFTSNIYFSVSSTDGYPIFSSQVLYFGIDFNGLFDPTPSTLTVVAEAFDGTSYESSSATCNINPPDNGNIPEGYYYCDFYKASYSSINFDNIVDLTFYFTPACSAEAFCSQVEFSGEIGYFCNNNGFEESSTQFYECLAGAFESQSNLQTCPPGTACFCDLYEECSDGGLVSPCTTA